MPVRKTKGGYKFGKSVKLYTGKVAKNKAKMQAMAIYAIGYKKKNEVLL